MKYAQFALACEGPTDAQFFRPLVRRMCEEIFQSHSDEMVEVPDLMDVKPDGRWRNGPEVVATQMAEEFDYLDVLFYHTDAAGDIAGAYRDRVDALVRRLDDTVSVVGIVPKREMEAWALADPDALCGVLGVDPDKFGVPADFTARRVEHIADPKKALRIFAERVPRRHYRSEDPSAGFLEALARSIDLRALSAVPQVARLVSDIQAVLLDREYIR